MLNSFLNTKLLSAENMCVYMMALFLVLFSKNMHDDGSRRLH